MPSSRDPSQILRRRVATEEHRATRLTRIGRPPQLRGSFFIRKASGLCPTARSRMAVLATDFWVTAAIVVQHRERILEWRWKVAWLGRPFDARDGTQVLIDSLDLMVGHVVKYGPRHDLEKIAVHRGWNAVCRRRSRQSRCTGWMEVIEIYASPQDLLKLQKRVAPFRPPSLIRRQVAGNNVWTNILSIFRWRIGRWLRTRRKPTHGGTWGDSGKEVGPSSQISGGVGLRRPLVQKVRVPAVGVVEVWRPARSVATVAVTHSIDQKAAKSH